MNRLLLSFLCLILFSVLASAAAKKVKLPDDRTLVTAIDVAKRTVDITHLSHKITTVYVFAPDATVEINGKTSDLKNIKVGLEVHLMTLGSGMDDPPVIQDLDLKTSHAP